VPHNNPGAYALERAKKHGIPAEAADHKNYSGREEYEKHVLELLEPYNVDLIALAGFMRILSPHFVRAYKNRIINIHPALVPKYAGKGM
jgi:phosphoribosylglycinamide formyltransferase-1